MSTEVTRHSWREGMSSDNIKGLVLALSSSLFIGASFIVKKKGFKKAGASGIRAGSGGYSYLLEPLWWAGMITMVIGEIANFAAYTFAPAIVVTPLGALSIIISTVLAHVILREKLHVFGSYKYLSKTDIGKRLSVPGKSLKHLHHFKEGRHTVDFKVWDENGHAWTFQCSTRTTKKHLKPVLSKGWREFVCKRRLISGDKVEFHRDVEKACVTYHVSVGRPVKVFWV